MSAMNRTLRSKHARALLWHAANGMCQRCGQPLGDDWEADHIVPWSVSHRTNVHEMQALCRECNRTKGSDMLRRHQREMDRICKEIVAGIRSPRSIIADVVPGGGKQVLAVIAAKHLVGPYADGILWVVPRKALQRQGEEAFLDPRFRTMLPHANEIRQGGNEYDPSRGLTGYVTTYQSLVSGSYIHQAELDRRRYITIFDEWHHGAVDSSYHLACQPIIDRSVLPIFMSGTFSRSDNRLIAALPYEEDDEGWHLNLDALARSDDHAIIRYGLYDALSEKAVKWINFKLMDGPLVWIDAIGQQQFATVATSGNDAREAIYTALKTDFARELFSDCMADFRAHRLGNSRAKMLVVAPRVELAREYLRWAEQSGNVRCAIAVSADDDTAQENIQRFKLPTHVSSAVDILVTVAMAYEGLDVPSITHVACLTNIRTPEWIGQMIARAWRVDHESGSYEAQFGMIYAPDDPLMRKIVDDIRDVQEAFVRKFPERDPNRPGEGGNQSGGDPIVPQFGEVARSRVSGLSIGDEIGYEAFPAYDAAMGVANLRGVVEPTRLRQFVSALGVSQIPAAANPPLTQPEHRQPTARERETLLRTQIAAYCNQYAASQRIEPRIVNADIKAQFGKARDAMTEAELIEVWKWLNQFRPIPGGFRG